MGIKGALTAGDLEVTMKAINMHTEKFKSKPQTASDLRMYVNGRSIA